MKNVEKITKSKGINNNPVARADDAAFTDTDYSKINADKIAVMNNPIAKADEKTNLPQFSGILESSYSSLPVNGRFGPYGGRYVPETLVEALIELEKCYNDFSGNKIYMEEYQRYLENYAGRPSLLYFAKKLTQYAKGARIYLKREDLNHTGSHKINNVLGQALLSKYMGKNRLIAETGAGQHGVATATAAALFDMECTVYMGSTDVQRQKLNVFRMELLGAKVVSVDSGTATLKDATSEALREWASSVRNTFYVIGSVMGPHPYPKMVRDFQSIIGKEARVQLLKEEGKLPDIVIACVGGGSNAMGIFYPFINDKSVRLIGVEAAGKGMDTAFHASAIGGGSPGVLHGMKSYFVQDKHGNISPVHSISAGLDYPGIGPEHAYLNDTGRAEYVSVTDEEAIEAFRLLAQTEGIIPALESSHAIAFALKTAKTLPSDAVMLVNLSGRGDKDVETIYNSAHQV